jgi:Ca2+/Na+ antiporter
MHYIFMMSSQVSHSLRNLLFITTTHHHSGTKLFKIDFPIQIAIGIISLILYYIILYYIIRASQKEED